MKIVLKRKQSYHFEEPWKEAMAHIEDLISAEECEAFAEKTVARIRATTDGKKAAFAWSGGKDSLVLADLCRRAGVNDCALFLTKLEFFLAAHPELIFPKGKEMQRWNVIMQRGSQILYYHRKSLDILLTGHRVIDGNTCGKDGFTCRKSGETIYAPI